MTTTEGTATEANTSAKAQTLVKAPWFYKTGLLLKDPIAYMRELAKLGDFVQVRGLVGFYFMNHPDLIRDVLKTKDDNISRRNVVYNRLKNVARTGLVTSEGEYWEKQRRTISPLFTPRAVRGYAETMVETVLTHADKWDRYASTGESFELVEEMDRLTLEVNAACLFNANLEQVYDDLNRWFSFVNRYMEMFPFPLVTHPKFPSPSNIRLALTLRKIDAYIDSLIEKRRNDIHAYDDLLSRLLTAEDSETGDRLTLDAVRHEVLVAFIAGYETTSTGLIWSWYHLARNPDVAAKLSAEVDTVLGDRVPSYDDLQDLPYLRMFVDEVMRVSPPAWLTGKATIADDRFWGVRVPRRSMIVVIPPCVHQHPDFWDEPARFDPTRFERDAVAARTPFSYIPFGGGPHVCLGKHFALLEMTVALAVLVQRFEVLIDPDANPVPAAGISAYPKDDLTVRVVRRSQADHGSR
jgi:cytochrome P450